jgi:hypothetical protein
LLATLWFNIALEHGSRITYCAYSPKFAVGALGKSEKEREMRIKVWLLMLNCAALLAVPVGAQTDSTTLPGKKGHQFSPALQKKVAERTAALRTDAAAPGGPLFDRESISWTIETAVCSLVNSQVKGTGFKGHTVWVTMNDDGSFHVQIRTEASGTAVDANGNKYIWTDNELAELDTPDPNADTPIVTGYSPGTFQLIPLTTAGAGYMAAGFLEVDTPTPVSNAPLGCEPP